MSKFIKLLLPLLWLIAGISIIFLANLMQQSSFTLIFFMLFSLAGIALYFVFHEFSVVQYLYLSPLLFIKPMIQVTLLFTFGLVAVFLIEKIHKQQKVYIPYILFFLLIWIAGMRSYFFGIRGGMAFDYFFTECLLPPLIFTIILNIEIKTIEIRNLLKYHVYNAAFLGFIGIILALLNPGERIGSLWKTAMTINGYYVLCFFIGIGLLEGMKPETRKYFYAMIAIILFGMIFTYTRIVLVGVVIGFVMMGFRKPVLFKYLLFLVLVVPFVLPSGMLERLETAKHGDVSFLIRLLVWFYSLQMIRDNPFWGMGFDSFVVKYKHMLPFDNLFAVHSHNIYLRILVEMGIVGFVGYMGVIIAALWRGFQAFVSTKGLSLTYMVWVALVVELIFCLTDVFISQVSISMIFWILLAVLYKMRADKPQTITLQPEEIANVPA